MAQTRNVRPPTVESFLEKGFTWYVKEAATQTFLKGALLVHSVGYAQESTADPAAGTILGIAVGPGQNDAVAGSHDAGFEPFVPGTIMEINLCNGAAAGHVLAQTDVGVKYGMIKRTVSGETHWVLDFSETGAGAVIARVIGVRDDIGDTNARVYAAVIGSVCALGG